MKLEQFINTSAFWDYIIKKNCMAIDIVTNQIIQKIVENNLFNNIIDNHNSKDIRKIPKIICLQLRFSIIYFVILKLFIYQKIVKYIRYKKIVNNIFAKTRFFIKQLKTSVTSNENILNNIAIKISTKFFYYQNIR